MAQIYIGEDDKCYHTKFEIGDIVRIKDIGHAYTSYFEAFQILGVRDWEKPILLTKHPNFNKENWFVFNLVIKKHWSYYDVIYHIKNKKCESLVINEQGLSLHHLNLLNPTSKLKTESRNSNPKIKILE